MKPLEWINGSIRFLDQTKLPLEEVYFKTDDVAVLADAINRLAIRGAPLIGIAAAYGVALASLQLKKTELNEVRSYSSICNRYSCFYSSHCHQSFLGFETTAACHGRWQTNSVADLQKSLIDKALLIHQEDNEMCERISSFGVELLPQSCSILTHCNAGALATGGRGTALGIVTKGMGRGKTQMCLY